jgi:hypothetical protein
MCAAIRAYEAGLEARGPAELSLSYRNVPWRRQLLPDGGTV